ncbi:ABC transporter substrate-binding protein/permease [Ligilactobacillus murinus]|uniref:ABC transporter substrate-binding protein/permease n=1 Tax=Ligilactobacillus murinus TaxID=1622 RepID=UPI001CDA8B68|nr:ABC transporter substrate-binding protein/permease [Ligilactobacillus murinus]MDO4457680.1 ABC transporter substrate-binding protein/permease [Ligilactobacillus murinus]
MMFAVFLPLSNLTIKADQTDTSLEDIKKSGKLVVGLSADYPPYEFTAKVDGKTEYVGIDIEIAKKLAKDLGVKLEIKNMSFDSLLVALETNKVDAIISAMNPTPERKASVDFSDIYYSGKQYIVINKKDASKYKNLADFKGQTVGAQNGSLQYNLVKDQMPGTTVKGLSKLNNLVLALQSGKINGIAMEEPTAKAYVANNNQLLAFDPGFSVNSDQTGSAIAFRKNSPALVAAANKTLAQIKKQNLLDTKYVPEAAKYMETTTKNNTMMSYWTYFAKGIEYTLIITVTAVFFGFILGTLLSLMRLSENKLLHSIAVCYIEFIRGTPLMVQVMFVYFGVGAVIQSLPALVAGIIATALNSAAYIAEVIRSGIESIPAGQTEAARSLGMTQKDTYRYVVIPQALKNIWPALGNEFVTLIKESSIVSIIGVGDLMYQTQLVQSATYKGVMPLFIAMVIYFIMTFSLSKLLNLFERKLNHG